MAPYNARSELFPRLPLLLSFASPQGLEDVICDLTHWHGRHEVATRLQRTTTLLPFLEPLYVNTLAYLARLSVEIMRLKSGCNVDGSYREVHTFKTSYFSRGFIAMYSSTNLHSSKAAISGSIKVRMHSHL